MCKCMIGCSVDVSVIIGGARVNHLEFRGVELPPRRPQAVDELVQSRLGVREEGEGRRSGGGFATVGDLEALGNVIE